MEDPAFEVDLLLSAHGRSAADLSLPHPRWTGTACTSIPSSSSAKVSQLKPPVLPGLERHNKLKTFLMGHCTVTSLYFFFTQKRFILNPHERYED